MSNNNEHHSTQNSQIRHKTVMIFFVRWSNYEAAMSFLKPGNKDILPTQFELEHLKQFKVSSYLEAPITPGANANSINQSVEIQLYNIHNNSVKTIIDHQSWEYSEKLQQWFLTSGIPKI